MHLTRLFKMEDSVEVILQDSSSRSFHRAQENPKLTAASGAVLVAFYWLWTIFALPGFRKVPASLKVPYLPSSRVQTQNVIKLLHGRTGSLADLGSGDGRLELKEVLHLVNEVDEMDCKTVRVHSEQIFAAWSMGFQCTGFEINSILISYTRVKARWMGIPITAARFVNEDFWKKDLSQYKNVTVFLAPGVMEVLGRKLQEELEHDARVIACRFPFPHWHATASEGQGLDQAWAYDMATVHKLTT